MDVGGEGLTAYLDVFVNNLCERGPLTSIDARHGDSWVDVGMDNVVLEIFRISQLRPERRLSRWKGKEEWE